MSSTATILSFFLLLSTVAVAVAVAVAIAETSTVYQALEEYNFPAGLLPTGVTDYTLNKSTGEFKVKLPEACSFSADGYDLKYKSTITGVIEKDKFTKLKGVSVKLLFFWVDIVEASRDEDELDFSIGIMSAGFDVDDFEESPKCGCGFDCNHGLEIEGEKKSLGFGEVFTY